MKVGCNAVFCYSNISNNQEVILLLEYNLDRSFNPQELLMCVH